jgi:orotate phosphoribosyltransferase
MQQHFERLTNGQILGILAQMNAVHTGHFVGTSGAHLDTYINKDAPGSNPILLMCLAYELAHRINGQCHLASDDIVAVIGAPYGAISLGAFTTYWLNELFPRKDGVVVQSFYAEKPKVDTESFKLRDFYASQINDHGVIAIEDILNTGGSALKTTDLIRQHGGNPIGVAALCNRGGVTANKAGADRFILSLADLDLNKWDVHTGVECPLCNAKVPMCVSLSHGQKFISENPGYPTAPLSTD